MIKPIKKISFYFYGLIPHIKLLKMTDIDESFGFVFAKNRTKNGDWTDYFLNIHLFIITIHLGIAVSFLYFRKDEKS